MKKLISAIFALASMASFAQSIHYSQNYSVTKVESLEKVTKIFNELKTDTTRSSQCYNRAMAWSYDIFKEYGVKHEKVLIYYTNKYRKEIDKKWGFHIAPLITVEGGKKYTLDREFHQRPYELQDWIQWFLGSGLAKLSSQRDKLVSKKQKLQTKLRRLDPSSASYFRNLRKYQEGIDKINNEMKYLEISDSGEVSIECRQITNVTYWDENPFDGWCFYQIIPMYYWGPPQLRLMDRGVLSTSFDMQEVWDARAQAFKDYKELWKREYDIMKAKEDRQKEGRRRNN